jgi:hypothetical protein
VKTHYYTATSLDGFIATEDDSRSLGAATWPGSSSTPACRTSWCPGWLGDLGEGQAPVSASIHQPAAAAAVCASGRESFAELRDEVHRRGLAAANGPRDDGELVWETMLSPDGYRVWTAAFTEGSYFSGSWEQGQKIQ